MIIEKRLMNPAFLQLSIEKKAKVMIVLWDGLSKIIWFTQHRQRSLHGFRDN